jgi:hypothetical protein
MLYAVPTNHAAGSENSLISRPTSVLTKVFAGALLNVTVPVRALGVIVPVLGGSKYGPSLNVIGLMVN